MNLLGGLTLRLFKFGHKREEEHFEDMSGFWVYKKGKALEKLRRNKI